MATIVLSYRREDSKWIAGRIFDRLEDHYGKGNVFMDIDAIPIGLDFREHIQQNLDRCDILVAVVGPQWLAHDETGQLRIADETDWVRIEIEAALNKKIPVVPVLIDQSRMPKPGVLPESVRNFAFRQAATVDSGVDFRAHMERLIRSIDRHLAGHAAQVAPLHPRAPVSASEPIEAPGEKAPPLAASVPHPADASAAGRHSAGAGIAPMLIGLFGLVLLLAGLATYGSNSRGVATFLTFFGMLLLLTVAIGLFSQRK
jgi:hypothetical protein